MGNSYDLLVIGAGIHGVGVAQAAVAEGYRVMLLEKDGPAAGTSGRSSKLIHGGLRYLETYQLSLVRECLYERRLLVENAPDLVKLVPFYIPVYGDSKRPPWMIRSGLSLYATLGGLTRETLFHSVPREEWEGLDGLATEGLQAVFQYYDGQTDDVLLTRAVLQSAVHLGAEAVMDAEVTGIELKDKGCAVHYSAGGREQSVHARTVVNAAGPWVNEVLKRVTPEVTREEMDLVQGAHIIVPGELAKGIYFVEAPQDRRAVLIMPWQGKTMVGTTETEFNEPPDNPRPFDEEVAYLSEVLRHYFPRYEGALQKGPESSFAGLRVLPGGKGSAFYKPRETILHPDRAREPRLLTIYGGKLTAYRATAEKAVKRLAVSLPVRKRKADTRKLKLTPP